MENRSGSDISLDNLLFNYIVLLNFILLGDDYERL